MNGARVAARSVRPLYMQHMIHRYPHKPLFSTVAFIRAPVPQNVRDTHRRARPFRVKTLHNISAMRTISFVRILPNLAVKLMRIPAMLGGVIITGMAYIQYQAAQAGTFAVDTLRSTSDYAKKTLSIVYDGATDIAEQVKIGWGRTSEKVELPEWLQSLVAKEAGWGKDGKPPRQSRPGFTAAATGAALGYSQSVEDDDWTIEQVARDDQMMLLTKKMIEIRSMLQSLGQSNVLTLPSIVVIGSQSSGKSSVLEAIVGHEFLPKGSNLVTRRPIELTLVNTPDAQAEYGEFPTLGLGKITDFSHIQKTLTDLNLAVPASECVSDDPIQLRIYSANVPDLSLIDLPGYIQVSSLDQPTELKQKISDLCDKYLQSPNIILAISAADVDLANSTSLRASRRVDPRGERTIGVVTKMDLVEPQRGAGILSDKKYPLRLGYVGVITRVPQTPGLFSRPRGGITKAIAKNESEFFSANPLEFGPASELSVGTVNLRKKLMVVLEQTMAANLQGTSDAVRQELEEATYEFKVQYNDRPLSAETYLAGSLDAFKHSFKEFAESFGRPQVKGLLKSELDQRVLDLLAQRYWNKPAEGLDLSAAEAVSLSDLPNADPDSLYWHRKLDASTSSLTKLGIGRLVTSVVTNALQSEVDRLISMSTFSTHPFAREAITNAASSILNDRFYSTSDQVENCIKPYKYEIEVEDVEWVKGRKDVSKILKDELKACESAIQNVENSAGGKRKLKDVVTFIDRVRKGETVIEGNGIGGAGGYSASLLAKGRETIFLQDRASILRMRLQALASKQCASKSSKYHCPEIFLNVVADKLTSTAVLFLNVELLSEFYYAFPRELDKKLGRGLSEADIERFAREDPKVRRHLDVVGRKELLETVLAKIDDLRLLESKERRRDRRGEEAPEVGRREQHGRKGWSLF